MTSLAVNQEAHFNALMNLLIKGASSFIFISGPADSGKTSLLQQVQTNCTDLTCLYIDSLECVTMTVLYERLLNFAAEAVNGSRQTRSTSTTNNQKLCSTVTEMIGRLSILHWPQNLRICLLLDEVERLFQLDSNAFSVLSRLPEMLDYKISIVMASREQFEDFGPAVTGGLVPIKIYLKSLSNTEMRQIIAEQLISIAGSDLKRDQVENSIKIVQQVANSSVKELSVLRSLSASIVNGNADASNNSKSLASRLPKMIQERMDASNKLDSYYKQTIKSLNSVEKYLLISAFIASFQTTREDAKVFGSLIGKKKKKSAKKFNPANDPANTKNTDKLTIQLPKLFDQTRLMAIFYFLLDDLDILPAPERLQLNIKSLCLRGLLKFSGNSAVKIDSLKYRVNISKDFAFSVADELKIDLKNLCTAL